MKPLCIYCNKECKLAPSQLKRLTQPRKVCNSCSVSKRRWKSKLELINKLGNKCNRCGYSGHPAAFQFHHLDPKDKNFNISSAGLISKDRHNEVLKCELLCANCHSIEHSNTELITKMGLL